MSTREAIHDRVIAEILDAAARLFGESGEASMADVAAAARISRATLYRHFPSRQALLQELFWTALAETEMRVSQAKLDTVPFEEGIERLVRAMVTVGDRYVVLLREDVLLDEPTVERRLGTPIRALFRRGRREGAIRRDLPLEWVEELYAGVFVAGVRLASERGLGVEETSAILASLFMDGARARSNRTTAPSAAPRRR